jgi:hypothetical protein
MWRMIDKPVEVEVPVTAFLRKVLAGWWDPTR